MYENVYVHTYQGIRYEGILFNLHGEPLAIRQYKWHPDILYTHIFICTYNKTSHTVETTYGAHQRGLNWKMVLALM